MNLFLRASDIVRTVPVYRLQVARDFDRLPDVVAQIRQWHSSPAVRRRQRIAPHGRCDRHCARPPRHASPLRLTSATPSSSSGLTKSFTKQRGWRATLTGAKPASRCAR